MTKYYVKIQLLTLKSTHFNNSVFKLVINEKLHIHSQNYETFMLVFIILP